MSPGSISGSWNDVFRNVSINTEVSTNENDALEKASQLAVDTNEETLARFSNKTSNRIITPAVDYNIQSVLNEC